MSLFDRSAETSSDPQPRPNFSDRYLTSISLLIISSALREQTSCAVG
jgi:hypothetical protein